MGKQWWVSVFVAITLWSMSAYAENLAKDVKKAVEKSTLNQAGTKPFHLKAVIAPTFERDKESGRTGEVEIWWTSPTQWKREVRSPEFHQTEIVDGSRDWQKNEGDYFPEWLRQTAVELINPVPPLDQVLEQVKTAEVRRMGQMTNLSWTNASGTADAKNIVRTWVALQDSTGLLLYAGGLGWGGEFKNYASFHGLMVARTVNVGNPQVTAHVTVLEDLRDVPAGFFDATSSGGDSQPLRTVMIDETSLRRNLEPIAAPSWPPLQDGPLNGIISTTVVVDRLGVVREIGGIVSENPGLKDAGKSAVAALRFKPFLLNGVPVQALSQVTIPFKTVRPSGVETFASASDYFERGRHIGFPAGNGTPYMLRAEFELKGSAGVVEKGRYEDTWVSDTQWRREAWFGQSRYVRSRSGVKRYQLEEGKDGPLLRLVFRILEPVPALDTFVESDWKIKRDTVSGVPAVRVLTGYESPEGKLDLEQARGYWFDDTGLLLKTFFTGIETRRSEFEEFAGAKISRRIDALKDGKVGMHIRVTEVSPAGPIPAKTFEEPGREWNRAFTDEMR